MAYQWEAKKGVRVDHKGLNRTITVYIWAMRRSVEGFLKQQARLFAQDMCDFTPPFSGTQPSIRKGGEGGFGNKARNKGRDAVSRDVRKIFAPLAQAPAAGVAAAGNIGTFNAWINEKLKLPAPHEPEYVFKMYQERGGVFGQGEFDRFKAIEARQGTPRTRFLLGTSEAAVKGIHQQRRGSPSYKVRKTSKSETVYVDNFKVVERYIKKVQQRVGKLKSGWYYAGLKLGRMPTSAWIASQGNSTSIYKPRLGGPDPIIKLGSSIGRNYSQGYHFMRMAMNHRAYAMRLLLAKHLKSPRNQGRMAEVAKRLEGGFELSNSEQ